MSKLINSFLSTVLCLFMTCHVFANDAIQQSKLSEEIAEIVNHALDVFQVPGAALGIIVDGEVVLSEGYGTRQFGKDLPVTDKTLFPIASCTKAFTALLLGQLVDEGKISLDDPVQKYIPEFYLLNMEVASKITIRDLLAHRTGVARHDTIWMTSDLPDRATVIEILSHIEPACGLRQEFLYNNFMYCVAGIVIERVIGRSWEEVLTSNILVPLEMMDSNMSIELLELSSDFSSPHAEINGSLSVIPFRCNFEPLNPAGGLNSNVYEMTKWAQLHLSKGKFLNKIIIQPQILQELHTIQMPFNISSKKEEIVQLGYGLGWVIGNYREHEWISHDGCLDGFSSEVSLLPNDNIGLVILANSSNSAREFIFYIRNQIIDKLLGIKNTNWLEIAQKIRLENLHTLQKKLQALSEMSQRTQPSQLLESYVGFYEHPAYGVIEVKIENQHLVVLYGNVTGSVYFKKQDVFSGQFYELLIYGVDPTIDYNFVKNSSGNTECLNVAFGNFRQTKPITFTKRK